MSGGWPKPGDPAPRCSSVATMTLTLALISGDTTRTHKHTHTHTEVEGARRCRVRTQLRSRFKRRPAATAAAAAADRVTRREESREPRLGRRRGEAALWGDLGATPTKVADTDAPSFSPCVPRFPSAALRARPRPPAFQSALCRAPPIPRHSVWRLFLIARNAPLHLRHPPTFPTPRFSPCFENYEIRS